MMRRASRGDKVRAEVLNSDFCEKIIMIKHCSDCFQCTTAVMILVSNDYPFYTTDGTSPLAGTIEKPCQYLREELAKDLYC